MKFEYFGTVFTFEEGDSASIDYYYNDGLLSVSSVNDDGDILTRDLACMSFNSDGCRIFSWAMALFFEEGCDTDVFVFAIEYARLTPRKEYENKNFWREFYRWQHEHNKR